MSLKAEFLTPKNFFTGEINAITETLNTSTHPSNEHTLCREQMKNLREENSSKNLIIKVLSGSQSAFKGCLSRQSKPYEVYDDFNVPFIDPKKMAKCHKKKHTAQFFITKSFFEFGFY